MVVFMTTTMVDTSMMLMVRAMKVYTVIQPRSAHIWKSKNVGHNIYIAISTNLSHLPLIGDLVFSFPVQFSFQLSFLIILFI